MLLSVPGGTSLPSFPETVTIPAFTGWVLELAMTAPGADVAPPVLLQQSDHLANLHAPTLALAPIPATLESSAIG
jgi:hypothetical protein